MESKILQQLQSPNPQDRRQALETLTTMKNREDFIEAAAERIGDCDRGVRDAAAHFILSVGNEKAANQIVGFITSKDIAIRNLAGDTLVKLGESSIKALLPYVDDEHKDVRKFAIDLLALLPAQEAVDRIASHLDDPEPNVVCSVVDALGELRAVQYADKLLEYYGHHPYLRSNIVNALSRFADNRFLPVFANALNDEDPVVQLSAAEALAKINQLEVLPLLLSKIETVNQIARPIILHSIVNLIEVASPKNGFKLPARIKHYLLEMLEDHDKDYVIAAIKGLRFFKSPDIVEKLIREIGKSPDIDMLIYQHLKNSDYQTLSKILDAAESSLISVPGAARFLTALIAEYSQTDEGIVLNPTVSDACNFVSSNFHYLDVETKIAVVKIFSQLSLPKTKDVLTHALEDEEIVVRSQALEIIAANGLSDFLELLEKLKDDENDFIREQVNQLLESSVEE